MVRSTGRTMWVGLAMVVALLVTGCGDEEPAASPTADDTSADATPHATARATEASDALAQYGLVLPSQATETQLTVLPDDEDKGMENVYRVTFTAPADAVAQMCRDVGISDTLPARHLIDADLELYGVDETPDGARVCEASRPDHLRQQLRVLFWGDPASVIAMLYTMPVR